MLGDALGMNLFYECMSVQCIYLDIVLLWLCKVCWVSYYGHG